MASSNFLAKINWRLIIIHTIACGIFIYAFKIFFYLYDKDFWYRMEIIDLTKVTPERMIDNLHKSALCGFAGLALGFLLSLITSLVRKWGLVSPVLVLLLSFALLQFNFYGWGLFKHIFLLPGSFTKDYTAYIIINGSFMVIVGLLLFLLKPINRFIKGSAS